METITLKPSQLMPALEDCAEANLRPFVMSAPGLGKSAIFRQFAVKHDRPFTDIRLSYATPVDLRGFPFRENGAMHFSPPADYPTQPNSVLLLDEYSCAGRQVRNAALELLLDGKIGTWTAPENTFIALAGNRPQDRANVERAGSAEANRVCFITLEPNLDDWVEWALGAGVDTRVIAFLSWSPSDLSDFDGTKWDGGSGFASPRSWEATSRLVSKGSSKGSIRSALLNGLLGQAAAVKFEGFLRVYEKLPSLDGILLDPEGAPVPDHDPSALYAVSAGLASKAEVGNLGRVLAYAARLPKEFEVFMARMIFKRDNKIAHTREAITWVSQNKEVLVG